MFKNSRSTINDATQSINRLNSIKRSGALASREADHSLANKSGGAFSKALHAVRQDLEGQDQAKTSGQITQAQSIPSLKPTRSMPTFLRV